MIWYEVPYGVSLVILTVSLMSGVQQSIVVLEASELLQPRAVRRVRLHYSLLAIVSLVMFLELVMAVASIEGGIYLRISRLPRLIALLPPLHGIWCLYHPLALPESLRPAAAGFWLSLFCLPLEFLLPAPLAALTVCFAITWFTLDAAHTLLTFQAYRRNELTRSIIPHMVRDIDYGLCVANPRGWIIEMNPAFTTLCTRIGLPVADHIGAFDQALIERQAKNFLEISDLGEQLAIRQGETSYTLRRQSFRTGHRCYTQLSLSDTTLLSQTSHSLQSENNELAERNQALEQVIARLTQEETAHERERICRMAHDAWSQQLAIAGLSVDMLIRQTGSPVGADKLSELNAVLDMTRAEESALLPGNLDKTVARLAQSYGQLGVTTIVTGQANFTSLQEESLKPVLREAFANAVRHAYARSIEIHFFKDQYKTGMEIRNDTLDSSPDIAEGRGLHDMRVRVCQAGGSIHFSKQTRFSLTITFERTGEDELDENHSD
ncbi:MAG: hypothetical protein GX173_03530 [Ruminococcaceae bacterium]|nr:hypothetical protein [Oscillospiraceae bacterium]